MYILLYSNKKAQRFRKLPIISSNLTAGSRLPRKIDTQMLRVYHRAKQEGGKA
ncbi:hypothetical protein ACFLTO_06005 [Chloroflexota bacterium]